MKLIYSSIFLCWSVLLYAQPLSNGMGIITHWSGGAGQFNSLSQLAYDLGFDYPQHFSKLFKIKTGMSPTEYRNLN